MGSTASTNSSAPRRRASADQFTRSQRPAAPAPEVQPQAPSADVLTLDQVLNQPVARTLEGASSMEDVMALQDGLKQAAMGNGNGVHDLTPDQRALARKRYSELGKEMEQMAEVPGGMGGKMLEMFVGVPATWIGKDGKIDKSAIMPSLTSRHIFGEHANPLLSNTVMQAPMGIGMQAMQEGVQYAQGQMSDRRYVGDFINQGIGNWGMWGAGSVLGAAALGALGLPMVAVAAGGLLAGMFAGGIYDRTIGKHVSNFLTKIIPSPIAHLFRPVAKFFGKHPMLPMAVMGALMIPMVLANPVLGVAVIGGQLLLQPKISDFLNKHWKKAPDLAVDQEMGIHTEYFDAGTDPNSKDPYKQGNIFYHFEEVTDPKTNQKSKVKVPDAIDVGDGTVIALRLVSNPDGSMSIKPNQVTVDEWRKVDEGGHYVKPYGDLTPEGAKALWGAFGSILNGNGGSSPAPKNTQAPGRKR